MLWLLQFQGVMHDLFNLLLHEIGELSRRASRFQQFTIIVLVSLKVHDLKPLVLLRVHDSRPSRFLVLRVPHEVLNFVLVHYFLNGY